MTPAPPPARSGGSGSRIIIQPELVTLAPGQTQQMTVTLCRDEGCRDCTASAHWDTLGDDAATVQKGGLVTAHVTGDTWFRASCDGPFNYATTKVRIPDGSFSRRLELAGAVCAFVSPNLGWVPEQPCGPGATDTQSRHYIDVGRAGWLQMATRVDGGHDWGDGLTIEIRCGDRLIRETWSDRVFALEVQPCRYELKLLNKNPYPQRYTATVQTP
jgi:hypothetical protein